MATKTFYVSVSKKFTQEEVFGFLYEYETNEQDAEVLDELSTRYNVSMQASGKGSIIPSEYSGEDFWASSVYIG